MIFMSLFYISYSFSFYFIIYSRWKHVRGVAHVLFLSVPPSSDFFWGTYILAYDDDFSLCYFPILCAHALDLQLVSSNHQNIARSTLPSCFCSPFLFISHRNLFFSVLILYFGFFVWFHSGSGGRRGSGGICRWYGWDKGGCYWSHGG